MPSRNRRNHNPGNIVAGTYTKWIDSKSGTDGRFATFRNDMMGVAALARLFAGGVYNKLTLSQAIARFAPPEDHNPTNKYMEYVSKHADIPATQTLDTLNLQQCLNLIDAMARFEGWYA